MNKRDPILCLSSRKAYIYINQSLPDTSDLVLTWNRSLPGKGIGADSLILLEIDPSGSGSSFLSEITRHRFRPQVLGFSFEASPRTGVEAVKSGASDFFYLPDEIQELKRILFAYQRKREGSRRSEKFLSHEKTRYDFSNIIGESPGLRAVLKKAEKIIHTRMSPVLIRGETGTGKGLLARAIHYNSVNPSESFVEVNCSALPETLIESELFGYEKGAFTGATSAKEGLFEIAHNGTVFLDEIGSLNSDLQVKLLNAIEHGAVRHLGGTKDIPVDLRIIAATSVDLEKAMKENTFRRDMYYRLSVLTLTLPSLRERGEDVLTLARFYQKKFEKEYGTPPKNLTSRARKALMAHRWPGNIRELKNTIERAVILSEGKAIRDSDLQFDEVMFDKDRNETTRSIVIPLPPTGISRDMVEKIVVREILNLTRWNKSQAARMLGVTRPTLVNMIKRAGIKKE